MSKDNFKIFSGSSHLALAQEIADCLKIPLGKITLKKFACNENYVSIQESVRGKEVFLVQTCTQNVNEDLMELFIMCDAMHRSFAKKVHVIIPNVGYSRQDKIHDPREAISAKLIANLLVHSGTEHVIAMQLHSDQNQAFFDVPVDNLNPRRMFAGYFKKKKLENLVIVSPDAGGAKNAKKLADDLGGTLAVLHKNRPRHNVSETTHVIGDVEGKNVIIYDDMIDTGGSVLSAHAALLKAGANKEIYLCATHAIFSGEAVRKIKTAKFKEVLVTNSVPLPKEKLFPGLAVLSIAPLIAHVVENVALEKSVSELYF
ncbi:ribose-phosphate diphosphokinase [Candidatus Peregrinibacteria bacterium]|nr:ribose-phosphate diphosphokinase [Candidatus Peregrinibacteria bacterium]